jgi:hypothetical protein
MSFLRHSLIAMLLCVVSVAAQASTISFNWADGSNGQVITAGGGFFGGLSDFDNATSTFNPIANASTITLSQANTWWGPSIAHSHFGYSTPTISALINGSWTQIWSANLTPNFDEVYLSNIGLLQLPTVGTLSGLAFGSSVVGYAYHGMQGLNIAVGVATPEPHEWALMLIALGCAALVIRKRQANLV